jgi:hypothetical protein
LFDVLFYNTKAYGKSVDITYVFVDKFWLYPQVRVGGCGTVVACRTGRTTVT